MGPGGGGRDDGEHDALDGVGDPGDARQEQADAGHGAHPGQGPEHVPGREAAVAHAGGAGGEGYVGAHNRHEAPDDERRPPVAGPEPVPGLVAGHGRQQADDDDLPQRRAERAGFQTMPARLNCLRVRARPHQQPAADAITAPRHSPAMVAGLSILVPARATSRAALPAYWSR